MFGKRINKIITNFQCNLNFCSHSFTTNSNMSIFDGE